MFHTVQFIQYPSIQHVQFSYKIILLFLFSLQYFFRNNRESLMSNQWT